MSKYLVKGAPFRYKGAVNVEDCVTSEEVIQQSGLNWTVEKCNIYAEMTAIENNTVKNKDSFNLGFRDYAPIDNVFGIYRTDYNIPLGIVKGRYTPVQNIDAFKFFDKAIGKDKAIWQTAGYFGNGERIFVSAKLPKNILVHGDPVENYLVFTTSHDGTSGVRILFTPIRVVCQNTLNAAIKSSTNYVSFRHTQSVHKNISIADEILGICNYQIDNLDIIYNELYKDKCTDKEAQSIFADIILSEEEKSNIKNTGHTIEQIISRNWIAIEDSKISMKKVNVLSEMNNYYFDGIGQKEYVGTKWGVYNAVSGYYSNVDNVEGIKRMDTLLFGSKSKKIETAGKLLTI